MNDADSHISFILHSEVVWEVIVSLPFYVKKLSLRGNDFLKLVS